MTKVVGDITMSLDGFVTGPDAGIENGLGIGGDPLHNWVMQPDDTDTAILAGSVIDQCLAAWLLDELRIHLAPIVLGEGTPLFTTTARAELRQTDVRTSANATHLTYEPL